MTPAELAAEAVDASYDVFGVEATYTAPGYAAVPCVVIKDSADRSITLGDGRATSQGNTIKVRAAEIAAPADGGTFAITEGPSLVVMGDPETLDAERLEWTCQVK
jgi:hypothetical protein